MSAVTLESVCQSLDQMQIDARRMPVLCAVSGGLDSMVLVHLLSALNYKVRAIHIDHAAHAESADWAAWVKVRLSQMNVPVEVHRLEHLSHDENLEEQWRNARYAVLSKARRYDEVLMTAHHMNDQAETLLLQLLRGAGPVGLQGMPAFQANSKIIGSTELVGESGSATASAPSMIHVRPLLAYTRDALERYANEAGLEWLEDPSNQNQRFARNYLRHTILPQLLEHWPGAVSAIARSSRLIAQSVELNTVLAEQDVKQVGDTDDLDWSALLAFDGPRQANAVRYWLQGLGVRLPSETRLSEALRQWRDAAEDRLPVLDLVEGTVQRYQGHLVFMPASAHPPNGWSATLELGEWLKLPGQLGEIGYFEAAAQSSPAHATGLATTKSRAVKWGHSIPTKLVVSFRRGGEKLRKASGSHQTLKHWFQENRVAPIRRKSLPLVFLDDELIAIADIWLDARFRPANHSCKNEKVGNLSWRQSGSGITNNAVE